MTQAAYTSDLQTITDAEGGTTNWAEPTGFGAGAFDSPAEYWIQSPGTGTDHSITKSIVAGPSGSIFNSGSGKTIPSPGAFLTWLYCGTPSALDTQANGGMQIFCGSSGANFQQWYVRGSNNYAYGGWLCIPVDPTVAESTHTGTPSGTKQYFGGGVKNVISVSKGFPFAIDSIRYGRCDARFVGGTAPDAAATFEGFAAVNDTEANRWGLIQAVPGGYQWQGLMTLGYGGALRMTDANTQVLVANTEKVVADFNKIEIKNASTEINWTSISFLALGTVSKGRLEVVDDCNVNIASCSFAGMDTFVFKAASDVLSSSFRNCGQVTANGAKFNGTAFSGYEGTANTSYLLWNTNVNTSGKIDSCSFTKGTAATHAIEFADSGLTAFTLVGVKFNGYNASNNANDSAIHIKKASGTVTITLQSGADQPSYRSDGATVEFVTSSVNVAVLVTDINGTAVSGARVLLKASEGGHGFPFEATVTIANSGMTATVTHNSHGLLTNDKVLIDGASHWQNNGVFAITKTGDNTYTYTLPEAPGSNPTGTIKATFVALEGLSGGDGTLSTSRSYGQSQPVIGWARKAPLAGPWFKPAPLGGSVNSSSGYSATAVMISDS